MNTEKQIGSQGPIKKQQLFVNPITLINKQTPNKQVQQKITQTLHTGQYNNFNQLLIDTAQSNITSLSKTKIILKSQPPNKHKNYRTSICPYGIECRKRLTCNYAHNQSQLRKPYKNRKNPCLRYQKGLCGLGAACPDYHGNIDLKKKNYKYKVLPCKDWHQKGHCSKGDLCIYLHGQEGNQIQEEINQVNDEKTENINDKIIESNQIQTTQKSQTFKQGSNQQKVIADHINEISNKLQPKIGQIFKTTTKKTIIAKQIIQEPIKQNKQVHDVENYPVQDENFNIEFNF